MNDLGEAENRAAISVNTATPLAHEKFRAKRGIFGHTIIHSPDNGDIVEITGLSNCVVKHE